MNKKWVFVLFNIILIFYNVFAESYNELEEFDTYIDQHKTQINWGGGLSLTGVLFSIVGGTLVSYAISINNKDINPHKTELMITGYSVMGISALLAAIGFPLWFFGNKDYLETLNLRQQYYFLSNE